MTTSTNSDTLVIRTASLTPQPTLSWALNTSVYPKADAQYYIPYGYQEIGNNDKYTVLVNTKALPLMFAYGENETISVDSYLQLDRELQKHSNASLCGTAEWKQ